MAKELVIQKTESFSEKELEEIKKFKASNGFVSKFCQRHKIVSDYYLHLKYLKFDINGNSNYYDRVRSKKQEKETAWILPELPKVE